jgi:glutamate N-acetyltransferase / amino-acid N-acetyltransferase
VSVTAPQGFVAAGGSAGIKGSGKPDVAVVAIRDGGAVPAAAVFTPNLAAAAPVQVSRQHFATAGAHCAGVVLTSGNANAATGDPGRQAARRLCEIVAAGMGAAPAEVLVCQTGLIGIPFPLDVVEGALPAIVADRAGGAVAGGAAADAILTTDTVRKEVVIRRDGVTIGGMAKGAAMLAPHLATMLAVLTTDVRADPATLARVLVRGVGPSFNSMTVDGATSTNDTVVLLASGLSGELSEPVLTEMVVEACGSLADQMAEDAEGATKVVRIVVSGATSVGEAHVAARKVADSLLVKCSLNGEDPYWGRVVSELGSAGVDFDIDRVSVDYGGVMVCRDGVAAIHDPAVVAQHLAQRHVEIRCHLGLGDGDAVVTTNDLGYGYLDENRTTS